MIIKYTNIEAGIFAAYFLPAAAPFSPPTDEAEIAGKKYIQTKAEGWTKYDDNNRGPFNPIPYEEFSLNITPVAVEIERMKNTTGDIHSNKEIEHLLPRFEYTEAGQQLLCE